MYAFHHKSGFVVVERDGRVLQRDPYDGSVVAVDDSPVSVAAFKRRLAEMGFYIITREQFDGIPNTVFFTVGAQSRIQYVRDWLDSQSEGKPARLVTESDFVQWSRDQERINTLATSGEEPEVVVAHILEVAQGRHSHWPFWKGHFRAPARWELHRAERDVHHHGGHMALVEGDTTIARSGYLARWVYSIRCATELPLQ